MQTKIHNSIPHKTQNYNKRIISVWIAWTKEGTYFNSLLTIHNPVPKPESDIEPVIDIRNKDKKNVDENASDTNSV